MTTKRVTGPIIMECCVAYGTLVSVTRWWRRTPYEYFSHVNHASYCAWLRYEENLPLAESGAILPVRGVA